MTDKGTTNFSWEQVAAQRADEIARLTAERDELRIRLATEVTDWEAKTVRLTAENERLREVVGEYPKTADGKPVYPHMEVWFFGDDRRLGKGPHQCNVQPFSDWSSDPDEWDEDIAVFCSMVESPGVGRSLSDCYSTREAALAAEHARENKTGGE